MSDRAAEQPPHTRARTHSLPPFAPRFSFYPRNTHLAMESRSTRSRDLESLWWKVRIMAPEARQPLTMEVWFSVSEMMSDPFPTSAGMVVELVPKPGGLYCRSDRGVGVGVGSVSSESVPRLTACLPA